MNHNNSLTISCIHIHACDDITILEILYHYHDIDNYIMIIDIMIISHITIEDTVNFGKRTGDWPLICQCFLLCGILKFLNMEVIVRQYMDSRICLSVFLSSV